MAENKKSFLLYADLIHTVRQLPDDKAGLLFKHVLAYVNDENPISDDLIVNISFEPIKQSLKRDLEKYSARCGRNALNGKKGGRPKKESENKPKNPVGLSGLLSKPKKADSDNDSVSDNDIKRIEYEYSIERSILNEVHSLFDKKHLNTKPKRQKWLDEIRKLIQIDKETPDMIKAVIKYGRNDEFWSRNFLTVSSIRKKNNSGVSKYDNIKASLPKNLNTNTYKTGIVAATKDQIVNMLGSEEMYRKNVEMEKLEYIYVKQKVMRVRQDEKGRFVSVNDERIDL